jgi:hypothetical protein
MTTKTNNRPALEAIMKPTIITCGLCGGKLHVFPFKKDIGKGRFAIETMCVCGDCGKSWYGK